MYINKSVHKPYKSGYLDSGENQKLYSKPSVYSGSRSRAYFGRDNSNSSNGEKPRYQIVKVSHKKPSKNWKYPETKSVVINLTKSERSSSNSTFRQKAETPQSLSISNVKSNEESESNYYILKGGSTKHSYKRRMFDKKISSGKANVYVHRAKVWKGNLVS